MSAEKQNKSSIWDGAPEGWVTAEPADDIPNETETAPQPDPQPQEDDAPKEEPQHVPENDATATEEKTDREKQSWWSKRRQNREQKKIDRQNEKKFEKQAVENRYNSSPNAAEARKEEQDGNKRDFIMLGVVLAVIALIIAAAIYFVTGMGNQKIYTLIDEGNFSTAYHAIEEQYEKGKNVDSVVYTFADSCVDQEKYKRAVASLEMLSEDAVNHADFFEELVEKLLSHGKTDRAAEVIDFMYERGGALTDTADQLLETYDSF